MPDVIMGQVANRIVGDSATDAASARVARIAAEASATEAAATVASKANIASPDFTGNPRVMSGASALITFGRGTGIYEPIVARVADGGMSISRTNGHWGYGQAAVTMSLSANMSELAQVCGGYANGTLGEGGPADYISAGWGADSVVLIANNYLKPMGAAGVAETSMQAAAASYTATTVTLSTALTTAQQGRLRVDMLLRTSNGYVGLLRSWTSTVLTVDAWSLRPDKTAGQIATGATLYINPMGKAWAANFNVDVRASSQGPTPGACALEASIRNDWGADVSKSMWVVDAVNLGTQPISSGFIARGPQDVAFRARAGTEAGFLVDDTPSSGDSFKTYRATGGAFVVFQGSTGVRFQVSAASGGMSLGARGAGVATAPFINFHTAGSSDSVPDSRIVPTGGTAGTADKGTLSYYAQVHRLYVNGGTTQGLLIQEAGAGETRLVTPNTSTQALAVQASAFAVIAPMVCRGFVELGNDAFTGILNGHFSGETPGTYQWRMTTPALDVWRIIGNSGWQLTAGVGGLTLPARGTADRPGSPEEGLLARNTDTGRIEHYIGGAWRNWARLGGDVFTGAIGAPQLDLGSAAATGILRGFFSGNAAFQWRQFASAADAWRLEGATNSWSLTASASGFTVTPGLMVASGQIELGTTSASGFLDFHRSGEAGGTDYQVRIDTSALDALRFTGASGWTMGFASGSFRIGGTQVVGARRTGWSAPTGTATRAAFDTSSVTLSALAERTKALLDDLTTHGLIGA